MSHSGNDSHARNQELLENGSEIYKACHIIRSAITMIGLLDAAIPIIDPARNIDIKQVQKMVKRGSRISNLIEGRNWEELFKQTPWLQALHIAESMSVGTNIEPALVTIKQFFKSAVAGYLKES